MSKRGAASMGGVELGRTFFCEQFYFSGKMKAQTALLVSLCHMRESTSVISPAELPLQRGDVFGDGFFFCRDLHL